MRDNSFSEKYTGSFKSLLQWSDFDDYWESLKEIEKNGWYVSVPSLTPDLTPKSDEDINRFLDEIAVLIHKYHQERVCGIVYVDDLDNPNMIKIYDPNNLGYSCGSSPIKPFAGWVISTMLPEAMENASI